MFQRNNRPDSQSTFILEQTSEMMDEISALCDEREKYLEDSQKIHEYYNILNNEEQRETITPKYSAQMSEILSNRQMVINPDIFSQPSVSIEKSEKKNIFFDSLSKINENLVPFWTELVVGGGIASMITPRYLLTKKPESQEMINLELLKEKYTVSLSLLEEKESLKPHLPPIFVSVQSTATKILHDNPEKFHVAENAQKKRGR